MRFVSYVAGRFAILDDYRKKLWPRKLSTAFYDIAYYINELTSLPKKITQNNILINKILAYSAKKIKAKLD